MTRRKRVRKILLILGVLLFGVLACILIYFKVSTWVKMNKLYKECSKIEEYRTQEVVSDPDDYSIDVNKLMIEIFVWNYGKNVEYDELYIFCDGSIAMGTIYGPENAGKHGYAIRNLDNDAVWENVDLIYGGKMSGQDLYDLLVLREKANFKADYYDAEIEDERLSNMVSLPVEKIIKKEDVNPWINAVYHDNGNDYFFFSQAADGIRRYLYDENAQQMLHNIEDSWYFDQWMTEIYGEDWRSIVTIYRTEDDFVIPVN